MSTIAVFIALGGTSYAVARNSVGTAQLRTGAVTSAKVRNGALTTKDLARSVLGSIPRGPRGLEGPQGPAGSKGDAGPRGPSEARIAAPVDATLSRNASVPVTVAALNGAAAGSYLAVFTGEASYREAGAGLYVICERSGSTATRSRRRAGSSATPTEAARRSAT